MPREQWEYLYLSPEEWSRRITERGYNKWKLSTLWSSDQPEHIHAIQAVLNELGEQGWELAAQWLSWTGSSTAAVFKRRVQVPEGDLPPKPQLSTGIREP